MSTCTATKTKGVADFVLTMKADNRFRMMIRSAEGEERKRLIHEAGFDFTKEDMDRVRDLYFDRLANGEIDYNHRCIICMA